jgi:archaetidylinositol phosphate synthase
LVLNRTRARIKPFIDSLGKALGNTKLSPNFWTVVGFLFAVLAGLLYALYPSRPYLAAFAIIVSGVFDVLDGAVARVMGRVSKAGSFNDSTLDRVAEVAIYAGIIYGAYTSSLLVLLALSFSLLVSYARAKGDSLFVALSGVGIGERAERLVALVIFSLIGYVWIGVIIVLILALVTFIQRYYVILSKLSLPLK